MKPDYDMVIMGDINLDWCSRGALSFPFSELVVNGVIEWTPIDELPGGSGLNFARFAQEKGYKPLLLGKIGDDPAGRFIHEWLQQHRLESGVIISDSLGTGKAFIARDNAGIRFLVNNSNNANQALSMSDIDQYADALASCRVLYVSGYCLMHPQAPRAKATMKAMELAHDEVQTYVVFDVVPHQFYKIYDFSEFQALTSKVDILISEVATMRRFLAVGDRDEVITRSMAEETVDRLANFYNRLVLRFGSSGCDEQIIWDARGPRLIWEQTGHDRAADKRGYGDRLTIEVLSEVFGIAPAHDQISGNRAAGHAQTPRKGHAYASQRRGE